MANPATRASQLDTVRARLAKEQNWHIDTTVIMRDEDEDAADGSKTIGDLGLLGAGKELLAWGHYVPPEIKLPVRDEENDIWGRVSDHAFGGTKWIKRADGTYYDPSRPFPRGRPAAGSAAPAAPSAMSSLPARAAAASAAAAAPGLSELRRLLTALACWASVVEEYKSDPKSLPALLSRVKGESPDAHALADADRGGFVRVLEEAKAGASAAAAGAAAATSPRAEPVTASPSRYLDDASHADAATTPAAKPPSAQALTKGYSPSLADGYDPAAPAPSLTAGYTAAASSGSSGSPAPGPAGGFVTAQAASPAPSSARAPDAVAVQPPAPAPAPAPAPGSGLGLGSIFGASRGASAPRGGGGGGSSGLGGSGGSGAGFGGGSSGFGGGSSGFGGGGGYGGAPAPGMPSAAPPSQEIIIGTMQSLGNAQSILFMLSKLPDDQLAGLASTCGVSTGVLRQVAAVAPMIRAAASPASDSGSGPGPAPPPGELTPTDIAAIAEMTEMGFTEEQCKAAYLRCGRNPEAAVNSLLG